MVKIKPIEKRGRMMCSRTCLCYVRNDEYTGDCQAGGGCVVFYGQDACLPYYFLAAEERDHYRALCVDNGLLNKGESND